jgi:tetratricopeptide (TPR) repeat protein
MLREIGAFPAMFTLTDLMAVAAEAEPDGTLESITSLIAKSVLVADVTQAVTRYRLLETTRAYALEKLLETGEAAAVFRRHADHVRTLLLRDEATLTQPAWLARAAGARDDLNAALDRCFAAGGDAATGIALTVAAVPVWFRLSCLAEHRSTIDRALAALAQAAQPDCESAMLLQSAQGLNLYFTDGPAQTVMTRLQCALDLANEVGAGAPKLPIIWMLSFVSANAGDYRAELAFALAYGRAAPGSTDILAPARAHRLKARALHDLGRHAEARPLIEQALHATRTRQIFARLNAYDNDHWISCRALRTRTLWMQGAVDEALAELAGCLRDALALDHAQSLCWALTFSLCPVAIWCGRLGLARDLVTTLLVQSRKTFGHWHVWGRLYDGILTQLEAGSPPLGQADYSFSAQGDLLGTLADGLATPAVQARVAADPDNWCAPEILRAGAMQMLTTDANGAERLLRRAQNLAARQGALSWELRAATSLAQLLRAQDRTDDAAAALSPVLARFTQGFTTQDLQAAVALMRTLEDQTVVQWPAARKQRRA